MDGKSVLNSYMKFSNNSLVLIGFSPLPNHKYKRLANFQSIFCFLYVIIVLFIPQAIRLVQVWGDMELMSNVLCTAELPFSVALTKMIVLYYNKKQIATLMDCLVEDWERKKTTQEENIMFNSGRDGRKVSLICVFLGHFAPVVLLLKILLENKNEWQKDGIYKNYTLYMDAYFPYTWNYTPAFEITCFFEWIGTTMTALAYSGTDGFFSEIAFHLSGQYQILRLKLLSTVNTIEEEISLIEFDEKFGFIVNIHERINSCIEIVENTFYLMSLVQILACSIQFCILAYMLVLILTEKHSNSIIVDVFFLIAFLTYMIANFYVYCFLAEQLQIESFAFAETAYECDWFNLPPKKIKYILLMIQRGRKPVALTAGKFCILNLALFASIIKTSMGYLSALLTMRKNHK